MSKPSAELAGEELAHAVAVDVMGWRATHSEGVSYWHCFPESIFTCRETFRPDLRISDAWPIVEHLKALGYDVEITVRALQAEVPELLPYTVEVFAYNQGAARLQRDYECSGQSLPECICRAALAAVRAGKGDTVNETEEFYREVDAWTSIGVDVRFRYLVGGRRQCILGKLNSHIIGSGDDLTEALRLAAEQAVQDGWIGTRKGPL